MKTLFILQGHSLSKEQMNDAQNTLEIKNFVYLPDDLKDLWVNIPADLENLDDYLNPILEWVHQNCTDYKNYVLLQGDLGAVHFFVDYCKSFAYSTPIYATSEQNSNQHIRFRLF